MSNIASNRSKTEAIKSESLQKKLNDSPSTLDFKRAHWVNGLKIIEKTDIDDTLIYAATLKRAREPILLHETFEEVPQRFINCLTPDAYVRPHMHVVPNQWEMMCWLSGEIIALLFDDSGRITDRILMCEKSVRVIEIPPFRYHSFVARKQGAYLEIRNCKYKPSVDRIYSSWSPEENTILAKQYQKRFFTANVGDLLNFKQR